MSSGKKDLRLNDRDTDKEGQCNGNSCSGSDDSSQEGSSIQRHLSPTGGHACQDREPDDMHKSGKRNFYGQVPSVSWTRITQNGGVVPAGDSSVTIGNLDNLARLSEETRFEKANGDVKKDCCDFGKRGQYCEHSSLALKQTPKALNGVTIEDEGIIPPWRSCIVLSIGFWFVYTSFEAIQNLQSSLNSDDNLGVTALSLTYLCVIIGSAFGPINARIFGPKRILQFGFILHICYVFGNFYPSFAVLLPLSALLGIGIGGLSMSMGLYLAASSNSYIAIKGLKPELKHGIHSMFNGIFYSCFKGTHISGNLISSLILFSSSYNGTVLENNVCGAEVCAASHNTTVIERPDEKVVYLLLSVFIISILVGLTVVTVGLPPLRITSQGNNGDRSMKSNEVVRTLSGCFRKVFSVRFLLLLPMFQAQAMVVMIMYTGYTEAFVTCTIGIQWVGYSMVSLGVPAAISSLVVNNIARYVGRPFIFISGIAIDVSTIIAMLLWVPDRHTIKHLLFILPAVAGFSEGILQPQFNALIASVFPDNLPSAYSAFQSCKCLAFAISLAISSLACLKHRLYLALFLYALGIVGYLVTEFREYRARKSARKRDGETEVMDKDGREKGACGLANRDNGYAVLGSAGGGGGGGEDGGDDSDSAESVVVDDDTRQALLGKER